ncbi:hypothetical protein M404DRAFT_28438 [Pisolithus tinctorius Marx 270]|uniref:Uncharacterized protein n=1 Tax=Pisolithus tinctorius Marx 270 TaxID=870435 RepID=A0A0C3P328_PISTI|nr:hypothetical protein M404DRAFT_28438 [Pisolithus tinctorius Marx 270]
MSTSHNTKNTAKPDDHSHLSNIDEEEKLMMQKAIEDLSPESLEEFHCNAADLELENLASDREAGGIELAASAKKHPDFKQHRSGSEGGEGTDLHMSDKHTV